MPPNGSNAAQLAHPSAPCWRVSTSARKRIAVIGTGGSIATIGRSSVDLIDYGQFGRVLPVDELFQLFPELSELATYCMTTFCDVHSEAIGPSEWHGLARTIRELLTTASMPDGIIVVHGTSTLEETAWFLDLTIARKVPVVLVGALRPPNALATDAGLNLAAAVRVASEPQAAPLGVLAVLNGEIHAARDVTKESTYSLNAFTSGELGPLGHVDPDGTVVFYRRQYRSGVWFELPPLSQLPRVDIVFSYAGADGAAVEAVVDAGARGIVVASLAPGTCAPLQLAALEKAARAGVTVAFSSRAGHGRILRSATLKKSGFIAADNLAPQKTRILLMLSLAAGEDEEQIQARFQTT